MIRVVSSTSGVSAKAYFSSGLSRADYYTDEIIGRWHGKGAAYLGISGEVQEEQFAALIENQHPSGDEKLNPRVNSSRTVGWDINFHAPKSLSLAISLGGDERLLAAFRESVVETMSDIEAQTQTRVRKAGSDQDRDTGNLCWAEFVHLTARPIGGIPDPHTHIHAYTFNTTFDSTEERWKAAKISAARREMPLHQARFHSRLALRVRALGYPIKRTRTGWEIESIDQATLDKFSRRTDEIERLANELHITEAKQKDKLGALTREGKSRGLTANELRQAWEVRLTFQERALFENSLKHFRNSPTRVTAKDAVDHAFLKVFAKDAVVRRSRLLAEAMRFGVGQLTPDEIEVEYRKRKVWEKNYDGDILITYDKVLAEEVALVSRVRSGKGRCSPLVAGRHEMSREFLSDEQQAAVNHILKSRDQVIAIRGGAGTGKTTMMKEVVEAIEAQGITVIPLAPSADASRDTLRKEGFVKADTVARFLVDSKLQNEARGGVIWVDEAGLLGTRDLFEITEKAGPKTRIILTGDTKQHSPVARGNAFHTLQKYAGLKPAEITQIRRQEEATYREVVSHLSKENLRDAFLKLDAIGSIQEIPDFQERYQKLAEDYLTLSTNRQSPLVVSPTRREGASVTSAIRSQLFEANMLKNERTFPHFRNLHWGSADKRETENYEVGQMIQYHQNGKGIKRGEKLVVNSIADDGFVRVTRSDRSSCILDLKESEKFQVFASESISLAEGEKIRLTRNGFSLDKRRHSNGNIREIESFTPEGNIKLTTGAILDRTDGHWNHGYCTTSYSSQSKSVRDVLIAQSSDSIGAASQEQFYVSVSRGKSRVLIYTNDRVALQESVGISEKSRSALDLLKDSGRHWSESVDRELKSSRWNQVVSGKSKSRDAETRSGRFRLDEKRHPDSIKEWKARLLERRLELTTHRITQVERTRSASQERKNGTELNRLKQRLRERFQLAGTWMKSTSLFRHGHNQYHQIRSFRKPQLNPAKPLRIPSLTRQRRVILQRPVPRK